MGREQLEGRKSEGMDHWAFLEEIEAPMWVDLTLEAQLIDHELDDPWFHTTHPIHQLSSKQLKASFFRRGKQSVSSPESLFKSPKLPESVSRSRGKDYRSRKWEENKHLVSLEKPHPIRKLTGKNSKIALGSSASATNSSSTITMNSSLMKPKTSHLNSRPSVKSKATSINKAKTATAVMCKHSGPKPKPSFADRKGISNPQPAASEVSSSASNLSRGARLSLRAEALEKEFPRYGKSSSSKSSSGVAKAAEEQHFTTARLSLRVEASEKDFTRHRKSSSSKSSDRVAKAVEEYKIGRHSTTARLSLRVEASAKEFTRFRKSSLSKSSIGSSMSVGSKPESINSTTAIYKEKATEDKTRMSLTEVQKKSDSCLQKKNSICYLGRRPTNNNSMHERSRAKILRSTTSTKPLGSYNAVAQKMKNVIKSDKVNVHTGTVKSVVANGKENVASGSIHKPKPVKGGRDMTRSVLLNQKDKVNGKREDKMSRNAISRMHFR